MLTFKKIKYWEGNCQKIFLNHEQRKSGRLKLKYKDREDIFITGDRSEVILNGDYYMSVSGSVILIESAKEKLLHIETRRKIDLLKIAYHLGNRHSPIQINHSWLRILDDPVLTHIVQGLGGVTKSIEDAFEPELGAYANHTTARASGALIHQFEHKKNDE